MTTLTLKINVNLPQLLFIVISAAENGEFERFGGFCADCYYTYIYVPIHFFIFQTYKQTHCLYGVCGKISKIKFSEILAECMRKSRLLYCKTNKEASPVILSVLKHLGSG